MLHREEFLEAHPQFHSGMVAYTADNEKVGEIQVLREDSLTIVKGAASLTDYTIRYEDVVEIRSDRAIVRAGALIR